MGGFDSYAFQIRMNLSSLAFTSETMNALQRAIVGGAPRWASMARLSRVGRWTISERFEATRSGTLFEAIEAHRPGGSRDRPTVSNWPTGSSDAEVLLTGADRAASINLAFLGAWRSGEPASLWDLLVETTRPEVDGQPAGEWIERLFRSLCSELRPRVARAATLGERMAGKRYGASGDVEWLTYLGPGIASVSDVLRIRNVAGIDVEDIADGLLVRIDPSSGPRRLKPYWLKVKAVEPLIGRPPLAKVSRDAAPPTRYPVPRVPTPLVPRPRISTNSDGTVRYAGRRYEKVRIASLAFTTPGAVLEGFDLHRCEFDNVSLGSRDAAHAAVVVRNSTLTRCKGRVVVLHLVVFDDCVVDGYSGGFWATPSILLRHVTLRGNIDAIDLRWPGAIWHNRRGDLARVHSDFYADVDWALDIREARFARCDIEGVPGHLVRRDPATQALVTRERALASNWLEAVEDHFWRLTLAGLVSSERRSQVLVACPRGKHFEQEVRVLQRLRESGIAEPD